MSGAFLVLWPHVWLPETLFLKEKQALLPSLSPIQISLRIFFNVFSSVNFTGATLGYKIGISQDRVTRLAVSSRGKEKCGIYVSQISKLGHDLLKLSSLLHQHTWFCIHKHNTSQAPSPHAASRSCKFILPFCSISDFMLHLYLSLCVSTPILPHCWAAVGSALVCCLALCSDNQHLWVSPSFFVSNIEF
jgi:hypothetical protein